MSSNSSATKGRIHILKTFPEQPFGFEVLENNTIEISSTSGKYNIAYAAGDEFPKGLALKDPSTTLIPAKVLATAISKTIFATGNDDLKPVMCGVLFQLSTTGLTFVATDAHKLVKYLRNDLTALQDSQFIMPKKPLNVLKGVLVGLDDEVKIAVGPMKDAGGKIIKIGKKYIVLLLDKLGLQVQVSLDAVVKK